MNYLVLDLEMCMVKGSGKKKMRGEKHEIIQIGAVLLDAGYRIVDEFSSFVKPEYGEIDAFIENLTGIKPEDVTKAPTLRTAMIHFEQWIGNREVTVLSWSDSDYQQLKKEMRVKKIKNHKMEDLMDSWVDFQRSFDEMLGLKHQYALEDAMSISRIHMMGRQHDGLCDAYNTARLFVKIHRQNMFSFQLVPISQYEAQEQHLSFSLGELFTQELLAQIELTPDVPDFVEEEVEERKWSIWRKIYGVFRGQVAASDENWNKILFSHEMKKVDFADKFHRFFPRLEMVGSMA